jgi:hypothetical protein
MNPTTGYYSIIQFCPDVARGEAANVGVVLLCPEIGFLKTRMAEGVGRLKEMFPRLKYDPKRLRITLQSIEQRLEIDRERFKTGDDLRQFAETRANAMRLTLPRSVRVDDPEAELNRLFTRLVDESEKGRRRRGIESALATAFKKGGVEHLVRRKVSLDLPIVNRTVKAPFGFQNGRFNVVQPTTFADQPATIILSQAGRCEIEGELLYENKHPKLGDLQLLVVARFGEDQQELASFVRDRLERSHARLVRLENVDELIREIRATAKPVDATLFDS